MKIAALIALVLASTAAGAARGATPPTAAITDAKSQFHVLVVGGEAVDKELESLVKDVKGQIRRAESR